MSSTTDKLYTDIEMREVITLLAADKPITKKQACSKLKINYNTTRLAKLISDFQERIIFVKEMRKKFRKKPVSLQEEADIVKDYLQGKALRAISDSTYRSQSVIKRVIHKNNIPILTESVNYFNPPYLSDNSIRIDYKDGDLVYSARYGTPAIIKKLFKKNEAHGAVYRILLLGSDERSAYQPHYELADLTNIQQTLGVIFK